MSFTLLSLIIVVMLAMIASIEIYRGVHRGFLLSLVTLANVIVYLIVSFVLNALFSNMISNEILYSVKRLKVYRNFSEALPELDMVAEAVIAMAVGSILFVFVFFVVRIILSVFFNTIYKIFSLRKANDPGYGREDNSCSTRLNKVRGAICGGISALLITLIVTCPIMGTLEVSTRVLSIVGKASNKTISMIGQGNVSAVKDFSNDVVGNVFYRCGGRWIYENSVSTTLAGKSVCLLSEIEVIEEMAGDAICVYSILQKPQNVTEEHLMALERLRYKLPELEICERLIGDVIRQCSTAWIEGNSFLSIKRPALNPVVEPTVLSILSECANTTSRNAIQNADTVLEVYGVLLESGILSMNTADYSQILDLITQEGMIEKLDDILAKNSEIESVNSTSMMMGVFVSYIESQNFSDADYRGFLKGVASVINTVNASQDLSDTRREIELSLQIQERLSALGISVSQDITEKLSAELLENLPGTKISEEDVKFIFEKYKNG